MYRRSTTFDTSTRCCLSGAWIDRCATAAYFSSCFCARQTSEDDTVGLHSSSNRPGEAKLEQAARGVLVRDFFRACLASHSACRAHAHSSRSLSCCSAEVSTSPRSAGNRPSVLICFNVRWNSNRSCISRFCCSRRSATVPCRSSAAAKAAAAPVRVGCLLAGEAAPATDFGCDNCCILAALRTGLAFFRVSFRSAAGRGLAICSGSG